MFRHKTTRGYYLKITFWLKIPVKSLHPVKNVPFYVATNRKLSQVLLKNIQWCHTYRKLNTITKLRRLS